MISVGLFSGLGYFARTAARSGSRHVLRAVPSENRGFDIKIDQLTRFESAGLGEFFDCREADVASTSGFDVLIVFVA